MMMIDFYVRCDRCSACGEAEKQGGREPAPPRTWTQREVHGAWAMGANPLGMLLCRQCTEAVDAVMGDAWDRAIHRPSEKTP